MPPGQYTVRLKANGQTQEQPLTVLKDPHSAGTAAEISEQVSFIKAVRADIVAAGEAVERVEALRVQLATLSRFSDDDAATEAMAALGGKLVELQVDMVDIRLTGQGQDALRFGATLLSKLGYLTGGISAADFAPTDQEIEVQGILHAQLLEHLAALEALVNSDVAALNQMLRGLGILITDDSR